MLRSSHDRSAHTLLRLLLSICCSAGCGESASPRDADVTEEVDAAVDGRVPARPDGAAPTKPDGGGFVDTGNDDCARVDARPQPRATAIWFVINPLSLNAQLISGDLAEDITNRDMLRDLLFDANGVVARLGDSLQFGAACHYSRGVAGIGMCPEGSFVPAAHGNATELERLLEEAPFHQGTSWASLDMIADEIERRSEPTADTVFVIQDASGDTQCAFQDVGADLQQQAVRRLASLGARVSAVSLLWQGGQAQHAAQRNAMARSVGMQIASLGNGEAFASDEAAVLRTAIEGAVQHAVSCQVRLEGKVKSGLECQGDVKLGGAALVCNDANGYRLVDASTLELTGEACERLRQDATVTLSASFPCNAFVPII
jgi:hypothetical protein